MARSCTRGGSGTWLDPSSLAALGRSKEGGVRKAEVPRFVSRSGDVMVTSSAGNDAGVPVFEALDDMRLRPGVC